MIDLIATEEQDSIITEISGFLVERLPVDRYRSLSKRREFLHRDVWSELGELGCFGVSVPESLGGLGLGMAGEALVFREFGRNLVSPAAIGATIAGHLTASAGLETIRDAILQGRRWVGLATPVASTDKGVTVYQLIDVSEGDLVLVLGEGTSALYEADAFAFGEPRASLDPTVKIDRATLKAVAPLALDSGPLHGTAGIAALASAAMLVGVLEAIRDMAVSYAQTRVQFGVPIGSFQSLKHKCADIGLWCEAAWSQTAYTALIFQEWPMKAEFDILSAKLVSSETSVEAARHNIQIHGGMGYTAELDAHLFLKRAHLLSQFGGSPRELRRRIAQLDTREI